MNDARQHPRLVFLVVLSFVLLVCLSLVMRSKATGAIGKEDLQGPWQVTLLGNTGCGLSSMLVTFTLNTAGQATNAFITGHVLTSSPCFASGDGKTTGPFTFTINTLNADGSGTAGLSCGSACGWVFNIQVSPDRTVFNLVDVDPANPNNLLQGVAIHQ